MENYAKGCKVTLVRIAVSRKKTKQPTRLNRIKEKLLRRILKMLDKKFFYLALERMVRF